MKKQTNNPPSLNLRRARPLVSVIMPVYNAGKFLAPAIESIVAQTYDRIELIIVDDASTDDSWKKIKTFKKLYPTLIRAYRVSKQTNSAGNGATNYGLTKAHGEFIARMDADDISLPKRIEKQVAYLLQNPGTILVGTQAIVVDSSGKKTGIKTMPTSHEEIYRQFGVLHPLIHPSVMIRRSLLPQRDRIYAMKWNTNDDYYTFFKLLNHGLFANLPEFLLKYRIHGSNLSLIDPKEKFRNSVNIRLEAIKQLGYHITPQALIMMLVQYVVISVVPSQLIVPLYMAIRGMNESPTQRMRKFISSLNLRARFATISKRYALPF